MHILAGKFKGRLLKTPKGQTTRPTTSLVRKAVFDMVSPIIREASFLDLFAGSGGMGIEAFSRGAAHVTFVEKDPKALQAIATNLKAFKIEERAFTLLKGDVLALLKRLVKREKEFEIIYIDPPYELAPILLPELLKLIDSSSLLTQGGILFVEAGSHISFPLASLNFPQLHFKESRRYGMTLLHIFQKGS